MSVVERLLKVDVKKVDELEKGVFKSRRLAKILGEEEPVEVEIMELPPKRIIDIRDFANKGKSSDEGSRAYRANLMVVVEGCVSPDLRDKSLQDCFGVPDAVTLAEKIFRLEAQALADAIISLSGLTDGNEETVKN